MKKIFAIVLALFFGISVAFADEVDEALSSMASEQVMSCARQMIQLGVDKEHALKMVRNMLMNQFKEEQILRAQRMIMNARKEGLPVMPLIEKAYEGMTKRVQAEKILQAMEKVYSRYHYANKHANGFTREKDEKHRIRGIIAQCLAAGLNDKEVADITYKLNERAQEMMKADAYELASESFMTARDMRRLGVTSMAATDVVWRALDHRYDAQDIKIMRHSFINQMRYTSLATKLARSYANSISRGQGPEMLRFSSSIEGAGTGISGGGGISGGNGGPSGGGVSGGNRHGGRH